MSSRPCAGITGSNQDVTPDLFRGHRFLPAPFFLVCLLRGRIYTLTHSLRSSVRFVNPSLSAKKHERDSRMGTLIARKCKNRVLRKPCDWLVPSAFANRGYRIKLREDVFLGCLLTDGIRKIAYLIHVRVELLHVKVGLEGRIERFGVHHHYCTRRGSGRPLVDAHCRAAVGGALAQTRFERLSSVQASVATKCLHFGMTERRRRRR